ncbi:DUF4255 domain-containing protein [Collimonas sp. H4R21]|uniref:DUF4255 domain-containing protein n=1 Tax=Collimonas rhizosphaerae TaxID=3126357 RepID=A0ABU9PVN8_9BURK
MSNSLAIAAATATLQALVGQGVRTEPDLNDTTVTTLSPDKARDSNNSANQINLFLYQMLPNAAWRNRDMPRQVMPGETGMPPLALDLYFLMTAYGRNNDVTQPFSHQLLGRAMSVLYDHALLGPDEIRAAITASMPNSDLDRQLERVRITLQPLSLEEISKLWTGFQTQYRLSVAYAVSVVLLESTQPVKTPIPVLTRGPGDSGVASQGSLIPPFPGLDAVIPPKRQVSVRLGELLTLAGHHLAGANIGVAFQHPLWSTPVETAPEAGASDVQLTVKLPDQPAAWPAGFYTIAVLVQRQGESYRRSTSQMSFSVAPSMTIAPATTVAGNITFTVTCSPEARPEQRVMLLLGDQEIMAQSFAVQTNTLSFQAMDVGAGTYWVRLRIDGVDSLLVDRSVSPPLFDPSQKVTVT